MVPRLGVSAHSSLCAHPLPGLGNGAGTPAPVTACPAPCTPRLGQQMREPTAFLPAPVSLCLESLGPEPIPHSTWQRGNQGQGSPGSCGLSRTELI